MESVDVRALPAGRDWHAAGHRLMLVTVVKTWGSSPRPFGSMMALREDGRCIGSVSGGCIEDYLVHRYTRAYGDASIPLSAPSLVRYGVTTDEAHRFGLPCGGTLELLLEFQPEFATLDELVQRLESGQFVQRTVDCATGSVALATPSAREALHFDGDTLSNTLGPQYRRLLIGAGALAECVATKALFNDFAVTVCDPRVDHRGTWSVPGVEITTEMRDDAVRALQPDAHTCIVALSHDPKLDDLALLEALHSPAFYVGAIEYFDETEESLLRLHSPVGLYIGGKTPAEIAVSVMVEILAAKNGAVPLRIPHAARV